MTVTFSSMAFLLTGLACPQSYCFPSVTVKFRTKQKAVPLPSGPGPVVTVLSQAPWLSQRLGSWPCPSTMIHMPFAPVTVPPPKAFYTGASDPTYPREGSEPGSVADILVPNVWLLF